MRVPAVNDKQNKQAIVQTMCACILLERMPSQHTSPSCEVDETSLKGDETLVSVHWEGQTNCILVS